MILSDIKFTSFIPSTVLGLFALISGYLYYYFSNRNNNKLKEIESVNPKDRLKAIEIYLNELGVPIDTKNIDPVHKFQLLKSSLKSKTYKYLIISFTLIILAIILGFILSHNKDDETVVSVFVQEKMGKHESELIRKGNVVMFIGNEPRSKKINDGVAIFQNLKVGDSIALGIDLPCYKPVNPELKYVIKSNGKINFNVSLQGNEIVDGKVTYNYRPVEGVKVTIDTLSSSTDTNGIFSIKIPTSLLNDEYLVNFSKKGFQSTTSPAHPQYGKPMVIELEK